MAAEIRQLIESTMKAVGMELEVREEQTGINMSYQFIYNFVGFDAKRIQQAVKSQIDPVSLEVYVQCFTLHELGHAVDRLALMQSLQRTVEIFQIKDSYRQSGLTSKELYLDAVLEEHEMNIKFEETAWHNAALLNENSRIVTLEIFERLKEQGMETYRQAYERDLLYRDQLTASVTEEIA